MYVCLCKAVTDKQIKHAVAEQGACSLRCLRRRFGLATQCGKCSVHAKQILRGAAAARNIPRRAAAAVSGLRTPAS